MINQNLNERRPLFHSQTLGATLKITKTPGSDITVFYILLKEF